MLKLPKLPETFGRHRARKRNLILMAANVATGVKPSKQEAGVGSRRGARERGSERDSGY